MAYHDGGSLGMYRLIYADALYFLFDFDKKLFCILNKPDSTLTNSKTNTSTFSSLLLLLQSIRTLDSDWSVLKYEYNSTV